MNDSSTISLNAGNLSAIFWPGAGMLCVSLSFRGEEQLRRLDDLESAKRKGSTAGIPLLYPWANRLPGLHYRAAGQDVDLDPVSPLLHFDDRGLPMHGVPWGELHWDILEAKSDSVLAQLDWKRPELVALFPFPHRVQMAANVTSDSLVLQTTVFADAGSPVPISFGFHPYFGISGLPRAEWRLQLPRMCKLLLDARGIPTGVEEFFGPVDGLLGDTSYDAGFALLSEQSSFSVSGGKHNITVAFLEGFAYAQVFAPKDKDFVALEPMTAATSALTSGKGLRVTEHGREFRASFRVKMEAAT
ncbi:MAG: aldose 1-epimerase [Candidatus Acidiferrum sp.]